MKSKENTQIQENLRQYRLGTISSEKLQELRKSINSATDKDLVSLLEKEWNREIQAEEIDQGSKLKMFGNIQSQIKVRFDQNRTFPQKRILNYLLYVAAVIGILFLSWNTWNVNSENKEFVTLGERDIVVKVDKGERVSIMLPDGTKVRLNSESELSYQQNFGLKARSVSLKGEGFFDVVRDENKPFHVNADQLDVQVLGTKFNVLNYSESDYTEITLVEGSVKVSAIHSTDNIVHLAKNEKVIYNKLTGVMNLENTSSILETAWTSHELVFRSSKLVDVFDMLSQKYGMSFDVQRKNIFDEEYTGFFDESNIYQVLDVLKVHFNFRYELKEDTIYIY